MDSSVLLDYALFQLTPTRTRCDLIVFYGGKPEKLASGLCEPFVSHLKFAKDEFAKGGYSIKLCPPFRYAPWFTKSTFQRFVRFISTPAVLERFVKLESEILQIDESSAQANESLCKNVEPEEGKKRNEESPSPPQENSKVQFQRLLETRKSMLRREQAMAYARGLVAGFEPDKLDDLILFADAFGASRLKQACVNFKELCNKKNGDGLWMKELAAMEAYSPAELAFSPASGIVLTNEAMDGSLATDSSPAKDETTTVKAQMGMPWPNQMMPPYMYNLQQLNHPYQGYPYPPMQPFHPQYAMNMQSPSPTSRRKSSPGKHHSRKGRGYSTEESEEEECSGSESIKSDSESEIRADKKHHQQQQSSSTGDDVPVKKKHHRRKSSSKTVVIRNINYITSKKRNGASDDDSFSGEDEGKLVNEVVESLEKKMNVSKSSNQAKKNDNWDAFQNLLMRDEEEPVVVAINGAECPAMDLESSEKLPKQRILAAGDSFLAAKSDEPRGDRASLEEDIMLGNQQRSVLKKRMDSADEDLVISRRVYKSGTGLITDENLSSSTLKPGKGGEDWFVIKGSVNNEAMSNGDYLQMESSSNSGKRESIERDRLAVDDSFMLEARPLDGAVNQYHDESPWRTDIAMDADLSSLSSPLENGDRKSHCGPIDDLCMVVEREEAWCTDQSMDLSFMEATSNTTTKSTSDNLPPKEDNQSNPTKLETKNKKNSTARVPGRTRTSELINSRPKRTTPLQSRPLVQKSKFEREEEARKKIEEQALQRQKRIAERTAASKEKTSIQKQNQNRKS